VGPAVARWQAPPVVRHLERDARRDRSGRPGPQGTARSGGRQPRRSRSRDAGLVGLAVKLQIRCKHCGTSHVWEKTAEGIHPTAVDGPSGHLPYPYTCDVSPTECCEPLVQTAGERMVADLAR